MIHLGRLRQVLDAATADKDERAKAELVALAPEVTYALLTFAGEVEAALQMSRGTPPDVWGASKDEVIEDVGAALDRLKGNRP